MITGIAAGLAVLASIRCFMLFKHAPKKRSVIEILREVMAGRDYSKLHARLTSSGLLFLSNGRLTPVFYSILRWGFAFFGFAFGILTGAGAALTVLEAAVCYCLPDSYMALHKRQENKKMLSDIEHLYNLMHLQRRAGAYIVDTITDSYRVVYTARLKKALLELAGALNGKKPVRESVDEFAAKFDYPYITTLADIIKHTVETGDTTKMLQDVSEQIAGIQQAEYIMLEGRQEVELILFMTLLFIGMAGCMVYLMGISFREIGSGMF